MKKKHVFINVIYFIDCLISSSSADTPKSRQRMAMANRKLSSPDISFQTNALNQSNSSRTLNNHTFSPVIVKSSQQQQQQTIIDIFDNNPFAGSVDAKQLKNDYNLGRLDGLVSSPNRCSKVRVADSKKIAAILLETNIIELRRHLLTITVQNQVSAITTPISSIVCKRLRVRCVRAMRSNEREQAHMATLMGEQCVYAVCGMQLKLITWREEREREEEREAGSMTRERSVRNIKSRNTKKKLRAFIGSLCGAQILFYYFF